MGAKFGCFFESFFLTFFWSVKKLVFFAIFEIFRGIHLDFYRFLGDFGSQLGHFFDDFSGPDFVVTFRQSFSKKCKNSKNEKVAPDL